MQSLRTANWYLPKATELHFNIVFWRSNCSNWAQGPNPQGELASYNKRMIIASHGLIASLSVKACA